MVHTILFIDDEPYILNAIKRLFRDSPYTLLFASGGSIALSLLREHEVSVIVSDMRMPIVDGIALMQKVQKIRPKAVRIILSGFADKESVIKAVKNGDVWRLIAKPWEDAYFLDTIKSAVEIYEKELI